MNRHIIVLQHAGDHAEAFWRLRRGGAENYAAQRYSLDAVAQLVDARTSVTTVCCVSPEADDQLLPDGVRSITLGQRGGVEEAAVLRCIEPLRPTHLLLRTPMMRVLARARRLRIPVVVTFADSFLQRGFLARLRHDLLVRELNDSNVLVVGNQGHNACRHLVAMGVLPEKVAPWDWPRAVAHFEPKTAPLGKVWELVFAGPIDARKGIGDAVDALALLRRDGMRMNLTCFGEGEVDAYRRLADDRGVSDSVVFHGHAPHGVVKDAMCKADVVLVPSRHSYPEGLPLTIYEAFQACTPIVGSDHPMFDGVLVHDVSAKVFRAADPGDLARTLRSLVRSPSTYERISRNSQRSWDALQVATKWGELVRTWLPATRDPDGAAGVWGPASLAA